MAFDLVARLKLDDSKFTSPIRRAMGEVKYFGKEVSATTSYTKALTAAANSASSSTSILEKSMNRASAAAKYFRDSNGRLRDSLGRFASESSQAASALSNLTGKAQSAHAALSSVGGAAVMTGGNFRGMIAGVTALAGAYVTAQSAAKVFNATVGAAAKQEYEKITIRALVQDDKKAGTLFDAMKNQALESPMFSLQDFLGSAKAYLPITRDIKQVEKLTSLTERLALSNPMQGLEGASFAIREAMSGDMVSLVERFNLPKKWTNQLKGKEGTAFIRELDKLLNRLGYTDKLKQQVADESGLAKFEQVREKFSQGLTDMGFEGLERAKPILDRIDRMFTEGKFKRLQDFGSDIIAGAIGGLEKAVIGLDSFVTKLNNDPAWNKLSIGDKLVRMTEIGMDSVVNWLNSGGAKKIGEATSAITTAAVGIGAAVGGGIIDGVVKYFSENPMHAAVLGAVVGIGAPGGPVIKAAAAVGLGIAGAITSVIVREVNEALDWANKKKAEYGAMKGTPLARGLNALDSKPKGKPLYEDTTIKAARPMSGLQRIEAWWNANIDPKLPRNLRSHYNGLDEVPYDGYAAILHKGERVVPAHENRSGNDAPVVNLNVSSLVVREEADIDRIAFALAQKIKGAAVGMA